MVVWVRIVYDSKFMIVAPDNGTIIKVFLAFPFSGVGNSIIIIHSSLKVDMQCGSSGICFFFLTQITFYASKLKWYTQKVLLLLKIKD